jgi:hypothetical protein
MRVLLKALMDVEAGNEAIKSGAMGEALGKLMDELQPEAAYFVADGGKRAAYVVFDLKNYRRSRPWSSPSSTLSTPVSKSSRQ